VSGVGEALVESSDETGFAGGKKRGEDREIGTFCRGKTHDRIEVEADDAVAERRQPQLARAPQ
jgi:hypothetical protein